jgi:hypothetical protein
MSLARRLTALAALVAALALPAAAQAQVSLTTQRQNDLTVAHSVLQKAGLVTLAGVAATGLPLLINKETLFSEGRCLKGDPLLGDFGCNGGLTALHFAFAATTLVLFISSEIVAAAMPVSPYDVLDTPRRETERTVRWINVGLFTAQPILGLLAAHPGLIGIPPDARRTFSKVVRTIHFGVALGVATGYTVNAALQW